MIEPKKNRRCSHEAPQRAGGYVCITSAKVQAVDDEGALMWLRMRGYFCTSNYPTVPFNGIKDLNLIAQFGWECVLVENDAIL